jgi:hypothetical protein
MGERYLTELADVLRAAGLSVIEVEGWQSRARSSGGFDGNRPWCIMWHHTASDTSAENDVNYICFGSPDSPIANLYLDRDGNVWVCAGGATNTNGKGGPLAMSRGTVPTDSMNTYAIGIEAANNGVGQEWPNYQVDVYLAINNALAYAYGLAITDLSTHEHWSPGRKIDPATAAAVAGPWQPSPINSSGTWNVDDIRADAVRRTIPPDPPDPTPPEPEPGPEPEPSPPPAEEDEMYIAALNNGTNVVVGSAVRPVSTEELLPGGPLADLDRYTPDPSSYWHAWLLAASDEYSRRVMG